jgi:6-phosphofructokinase 2
MTMATFCTLTMNPAVDVQTSTHEVHSTQKLRCAAPHYYPGGGGINVARALRELGGDVVAVFPAGGRPGELLDEFLTIEGVPHQCIPIAGETRRNLSVDERCSGQQYRFVLPGPQLSLEEQRACLDALATAAKEARFVVASGSLPSGVPASFYCDVAAVARKVGARFILDTSADALRETSGAYLVKPSLRELSELAGHGLSSREDQISAARAAIGRGLTEVMVLSLGAEGALLVTEDRAEFCPAIKVSVASSIGAGDSMLAAVTLGLSRGLELGECLRFGVAASAAALLRPGTQLCRREDTERFYQGLRRSKTPIQAVGALG